MHQIDAAVFLGGFVLKRSRTHDFSPTRLTVTLAPGQREILNRIAQFNSTTRAHVVRYALAKFIEEHRAQQLKLEFPPDHF